MAMTSTSATLITGANVWDGISAQPVPRQVLVADGRIERIADAIDPPADVRVVDLSGHTAPGFAALAIPARLLAATRRPRLRRACDRR
jgi:dihydroorotase-like cyclic amidohydrolase